MSEGLRNEAARGNGAMKRNPQTVCRNLSAAIVTAVIQLGAAYDAHAAWEFAHADRANRGFVNVVTAPAGKGSKSVPGLGTFAPGAGPVIAPDGTVYLGTVEGKLIALHADGSPFWSRNITKGQAIVASPAIGADGSIYVVGVQSKRVRDFDDPSKDMRTAFESTLHKFTASGGWTPLGAFPKLGGEGAFTTAPPNIVRIGDSEFAVFIPAIYRNRASFRNEVRLIGFSTSGAVELNQLVAKHKDVITGGSGMDSWKVWACLVPLAGWPACLSDYNPDRVPGPPPPMPGAAIFRFSGGPGHVFVIVSDQLHDIVGYSFAVEPSRLTETFRVRDEARRLLSAPMVSPEGQTIVGASDGVVFAGPIANKLPAITSNIGAVLATPTTLFTGGVVVAAVGPKDVGVALIQGGKQVNGRSFPGRSIASAASKTHIFITATDAFYTLDPGTLSQVSKIDLIGGGLSPPAIGPQGHVYTIASNILFVFPPPRLITKPGVKVPKAVARP